MISSLQGCNGFLQRTNSLQLLQKKNGSGNGHKYYSSSHTMANNSTSTSADENAKSTRKSNKSKDAAWTHAMAERKRRERINAHLHTLKKLFPYLPKKDKSRVLTEAVTQLKELRKKVAQQLETKKDDKGGCCSNNEFSSLFLPSETDEVAVSYYEGSSVNEGQLMVKATVCCEDRPALNRDLSMAVSSVQGRVIKAEMATVGCRTKAELVVVLCKENGGERDIAQLRRALRAVIENRALGLGSSVVLGRRFGC